MQISRIAIILAVFMLCSLPAVAEDTKSGSLVAHNPVDGPAFTLLDDRVHVHKVALKFSRNQPTNGGFTRAHKTGQDDVFKGISSLKPH